MSTVSMQQVKELRDRTQAGLNDCKSALQEAGVVMEGGQGPVVTGVGAELDSVRSIMAGEQASTIFLDPRVLATQAAAMADQLATGATVDVNDTRIENGAKRVPSFLVEPALVTAETADPVLVQSGWYTTTEVQPQ